MEVIDPVIYFSPNVTQFYDMNGLTAAFRDARITMKADTYQGRYKQSCADPEEGRGSGPPPPLESHKNIGFLESS